MKALSMFEIAVVCVVLAGCKPAESSTTPVEETADPGTPCKAKFQATHAYVSFAIEPDASAFPLGALAAEEILTSLRSTGCAPRLELPDHALMLDSLRKGALIVSEITYLGAMPDVVKVTAHEASYGDTNIPDARAFTIHLHREIGRAHV